jgi:hypothetical protein
MEIKIKKNGDYNKKGINRKKIDIDFITLYNEGMSATSISKMCNVSRPVIVSRLREKGIDPNERAFSPHYRVRGRKHPSWKGGISKEPYCELWTEEFKERCRDFWNRRCGISGITEKENGRRLDVHHISYDKDSCCELKQFNCAPNLFIAVSKKWNAKFNNNRDYWEEYLTNYIMIWFNGQCYLPKRGC